MLLELIEQAQSAVTQKKKAIGGRVLTDYDGKCMIQWFCVCESILLTRSVNDHNV